MSKHVWGSKETQFFFHLDPNLILSCIDALDYRTTGRCLALNSMENRVYEIEVEDREDRNRTNSLVAKFYRPGRWSEEQILEEHRFLTELQENDIPVIALISIAGKTLFTIPDHQLFYAIFPKKGGRIPDEMDRTKLEVTGRLLARIHNIGSQSDAPSRLRITPQTFGRDNLHALEETRLLPELYLPAFKNVVNQICDLVEPMFEGVATHRIHGDCHRSNLIYREPEGLYFVDFDDMLVGPAVQDIWLIVPGDDPYAVKDRELLIRNYEMMREFDWSTLRLIEPLRALRFIHFATWMAKRWDDPSFKAAFPYFGSDEYWSTMIRDLQMQVAKIQGVEL